MVKIDELDNKNDFVSSIELSTSFDNEYTSDGNHDETFTSNIVMVCPSIEKRFVLAYSCLNIEQIVSRREDLCILYRIIFRRKFIVSLHYFPIKSFSRILLMNILHI
jgi:hypothetical protein